MNHNKNIIIFILTAFTTLFIYILAYLYQLGRGVDAEWWVLNVTQKKMNIADNNKENRLLIISGSNAMFGFDSYKLSHLINKNVINLSIHAGLDISYYRMMLDNTVVKGDVVIMPLEYIYYSREDEYSDWHINNMIAWGHDYLNWIPVWKKIEFFSHVSFQRVLKGLLSEKKTNTDSYSNVIKYKNDEGTYKGYNYTSLNNKGDINRFNYTSPDVIEYIQQPDKHDEELSYYINDYKNVTTYAKTELLKIKKLIEGRGGVLYLSWPTTMKSKYFNRYNKHALYLVHSIKDQLSPLGFTFLCDPFYANLEQSYFLDTNYHLNGNGAKKRSEYFAQCYNNKQSSIINK
ncbi:hypothetical protein NRZ30_04110 [Aeromonas jandaei]|uniref:hypothetical protein n=1 Tax=Aeromonas jandaei TaxID=650 RepID=UPI00227C76F9|nr:hypothetical protein [Aeromonas jandaei]WAG08257.1 hypothetical protein NRZ30_04110 [Aeromonas jandaei]